jgi:hypothetical protein
VRTLHYQSPRLAAKNCLRIFPDAAQSRAPLLPACISLLTLKKLKIF